MPFDFEKLTCCFGTCVKQYLQLLIKFVPGIKSEEEIFKTCRNKGVSSQPMGRNYLAQVGKNVASKKQMIEPEK